MDVTSFAKNRSHSATNSESMYDDYGVLIIPAIV